MRNLLMALVVVALVAAPSFGVINVKMTADKTTLNFGDTTTVYVYAQADTGVYSIGGNVTGSSSAVSANAGTFVVDPAFIPTSLYTAKPGTVGTNGGWSSFGSLQANWSTPDGTVGATPAWALFGKYTVTAGASAGTDTLTFAGATVSGFKPTEVNKAVVMGTITPLTLTVTPEPITMALLALGGLVVARRRRA